MPDTIMYVNDFFRSMDLNKIKKGPKGPFLTASSCITDHRDPASVTAPL